MKRNDIIMYLEWNSSDRHTHCQLANAAQNYTFHFEVQINGRMKCNEQKIWNFPSCDPFRSLSLSLLPLLTLSGPSNKLEKMIHDTRNDIVMDIEQFSNRLNDNHTRRLTREICTYSQPIFFFMIISPPCIHSNFEVNDADRRRSTSISRSADDIDIFTKIFCAKGTNCVASYRWVLTIVDRHINFIVIILLFTCLSVHDLPRCIFEVLRNCSDGTNS